MLRVRTPARKRSGTPASPGCRDVRKAPPRDGGTGAGPAGWAGETAARTHAPEHRTGPQPASHEQRFTPSTSSPPTPYPGNVTVSPGFAVRQGGVAVSR